MSDDTQTEDTQTPDTSTEAPRDEKLAQLIKEVDEDPDTEGSMFWRASGVLDPNP